TNPRNVLNRLFGKASEPGKSTPVDPLDRSMLDLVIGGARDLRRTLPQDDRHKLDEYLDSVRSVERRIAAIEYRQKEAALEKAGVAASKRHAPDSPPIEIKIPNGVSYPELGFNDEHHSQTHHNNGAEMVRKVAAITAFNIAQFAYMVKKMA